ncbi:homeodomain-interacting protein kinase 1-like [Denticeps clupeoides]|uniref:homeodomain-interacting protein kinase 1-like n=1 Tax=Denticeps clupeoides TaxID=299321 RepID=UPI0010A411DF|nr:homeodomain-interacting protein kinase 1-like [Denticeps clupeoides]
MSLKKLILKSSSTNYEVEHFLGRGVYGKVMKCKNHDTGETVAIKVVKSKPHYTTQEGIEAEILSELRSADADKYNIVRFYESFMHDNRLCLVFEMLPMTLGDFQQKKPLPLGHIRSIIKQLAMALVKLKSLGLIHADLKPHNIMMVEPVKPPYHIKVIDFGLACHTSNPTSILQSMWYRSPEVILDLPVDEAIDMWSLGCIMAELFTGWPLYPSQTEYDQIRYIVETQGLPHEAMLNAGAKTIFYFTKGSGPMWRLKKKHKCTSGTGVQSKVFRQGGIRSLHSLFNVNMPKPDTADFLLEMMDRVMFINLLKKMLTLDPKKRISPQQVLQHSFITMNHIMHYPLYNGISNNQQAVKQDFSHIKSSDHVVQLCPSTRHHMSDKIVQISVENGSTQRITAVDQTHAVGHEIQTQNTNPSKHRTEQNEHKKPRGTKRSASSMDT